MRTPLFTVVIPVRNGERYIAAAVDSLLAQSFSDFQLVILENGSEDGTGSILQAYHDPRVSLCPASRPLPIHENWRRILDLDLAGYLTILSHDDALYPGFLEEIARLIAAEPGASLYQTHFDLIDAEGRRVRRCRPIPYFEKADDFLQARHRFQRDSYGSGYVMRSADFRQMGGFPSVPGLLYADDFVWQSLARLSGKVCSPQTLFAYRVHAQSAAHRVDLWQHYQAAAWYLRALGQNGHLRNRQAAALARRFVERSFNGECHRVLAGLMADPDPERQAAFTEVRRRLQQAARQERLFAPYDWVSAVYEHIVLRPAWRRWAGPIIARLRSIRRARRTGWSSEP